MIGGWSESFYGSHRSSAHAKDVRLRTFDYNPNRKSLSDPHPVKIALNKVLSRICSMLTESLGRAELSARELQVLQQLAEGNSNKKIGQKLKITEHTVKARAKSILVKLGAAGRTEAIAIARKRGVNPRRLTIQAPFACTG